MDFDLSFWDDPYSFDRSRGFDEGRSYGSSLRSGRREKTLDDYKRSLKPDNALTDGYVGYLLQRGRRFAERFMDEKRGLIGNRRIDLLRFLYDSLEGPYLTNRDRELYLDAIRRAFDMNYEDDGEVMVIASQILDEYPAEQIEVNNVFVDSASQEVVKPGNVSLSEVANLLRVRKRQLGNRYTELEPYLDRGEIPFDDFCALIESGVFGLSPERRIEIYNSLGSNRSRYTGDSDPLRLASIQQANIPKYHGINGSSVVNLKKVMKGKKRFSVEEASNISGMPVQEIEELLRSGVVSNKGGIRAADVAALALRAGADTKRMQELGFAGSIGNIQSYVSNYSRVPVHQNRGNVLEVLDSLKK